MSYTANLWLYFALVFGIIIVPGMDMLYVLTNALTGGRKAGLCATAGIMAGGVVHTAFGALSAGALLSFVPSLFTVMLFVGAAYMAWIGVTLVRSSITISHIDGAEPHSLRVAFRQGAVTCLLNPKAYPFVFTVFPQFLRPQYGALLPQALAIGALTALTQLGIYGGLALAAARARRLITSSPQGTALAGRLAGGLFIIVAVLTAWHGVAALRM
jgi:threonine/homoserine/homoserine lactone efflux protein